MNPSLDGARVEEALDDLLVCPGEALVDVAHALAQRLLQRLVGHLVERLGTSLQGHSSADRPEFWSYTFELHIFQLPNAVAIEVP